MRKRLIGMRWRSIEEAEKYLIEFEANFIRRKGKVIWARHSADAFDELNALARTHEAGFSVGPGPLSTELGLPAQLAPDSKHGEPTKPGRHSKTIVIREARYLVADPGAVLTAAGPPAQKHDIEVWLVPVDRILPSLRDVYLVTRPWHGEAASPWSLRFGPAPGRKLHVLIVDNYRSDIMGVPRVREVLRCLSCGGCQAFDSVAGTPGAPGTDPFDPVDAVRQPHVKPAAAFKKSFMHPLDNRVSDMCPVGIDFKRLLLYNRKLAADQHMTGRPRLFYYFWKNAVTRRGIIASRGLKTLAHYNHILFNKSVSGKRAEMRAPRKSFNRLWRERNHLN